MLWRFRHHTLDLRTPRVIAILNLTPDSFHDGGRLASADAALSAARAARADGADILDLGAESTRPGAASIPADEQLRRLLPALRAIRAAGRAPRDATDAALARVAISIDTTRASVAEACLAEGADIINDVSAGLDDPAMLPLAARTEAGLILMHRLRPPASDSYSDKYAQAPHYEDVVVAVREFLRERLAAAIAAGVSPDAIILDPGLGFGKSVEQNMELIARTSELMTLGRPILSALSRKSFVGRVSLGRDSTSDERLPGTMALTEAHYRAGARIFRVHDVAPIAQTLRALDSPNVR